MKKSLKILIINSLEFGNYYLIQNKDLDYSLSKEKINDNDKLVLIAAVDIEKSETIKTGNPYAFYNNGEFDLLICEDQEEAERTISHHQIANSSFKIIAASNEITNCLLIEENALADIVIRYNFSTNKDIYVKIEYTKTCKNSKCKYGSFKNSSHPCRIECQNFNYVPLNRNGKAAISVFANNYTYQQLRHIATRFAYECRLKGVQSNNDTVTLFNSWFDDKMI